MFGAHTLARGDELVGRAGLSVEGEMDCRGKEEPATCGRKKRGEWAAGRGTGLRERESSFSFFFSKLKLNLLNSNKFESNSNHTIK
jgi:hypothetical protein